ncbi:hypothetical protein HMPREF1986_01068 [Oribacterium sp. oral taxon 078 str. F0263]|nr:hypothetical protein HMPREF1986_01068 [Oribacterium sp. oral taxon 078 str. F0263]
MILCLKSDYELLMGAIYAGEKRCAGFFKAYITLTPYPFGKGDR